jgi:hypothetical protein
MPSGDNELWDRGLVLVNLETTPVQLHAKPFASADPTGRRNSSYLAADGGSSRRTGVRRSLGGKGIRVSTAVHPAGHDRAPR